MSTPVLINLLNKMGKAMKCEACCAFYRVFFRNEFNKFNKQEHECQIQFITLH